MNQDKYIFAQLTDFLPRRQFDSIVAKYSGNKYVKSFTCWNQMLCKIFGQLTAWGSMRDLMLMLRTGFIMRVEASISSTEDTSTSPVCIG
jgi:hypothetical protein